MKTYQYIFLTSFLFVILFYEESLGVNLAILGLILSSFTYFKTSPKTKSLAILYLLSILSSVAFAWFGDFASFCALASSLLILAFKAKNERLHMLMIFPVMIVNVFTFPFRLLRIDQWLPTKRMGGATQKFISVLLIPIALFVVFFAIYSAGSDHFADLIKNINWDFNFWQMCCLAVLGLCVGFNFWNFYVERILYKSNHYLDDDFTEKTMESKSTYSFLDIDSERKSGVISFVMLNILLVFFIFTYNYEQFYQVVKSPNVLSEETHDRVGAVIISIIMAVAVIMFFFKSTFNFDPKAKSLKILAKNWIVLNAVLVLSTLLKNSEYIINYGLTYKRLGVYAFLGLSLFGLGITFYKIWKKKTNAFLFNKAFWSVYAMILLTAFINWGGMITKYNLSKSSFDTNYLLNNVEFNDKEMLEFTKSKGLTDDYKAIVEKVKNYQKQSFLSKSLYYETIDY